MAIFTGIFEKFTSLPNIPLTDVLRWLSFKGDKSLVENSIGNRILYPQVVSVNKLDYQIDLAILKEVINRQPELVFDSLKNRIVLPKQLILRFPPLIVLITIISETLTLNGVVPIYLNDSDGKNEGLGTIVKPRVTTNLSTIILLNGQNIKVNFGKLNILPLPDKEAILKVDSEEIKVIGGQIGVVLDLRK